VRALIVRDPGQGRLRKWHLVTTDTWCFPQFALVVSDIRFLGLLVSVARWSDLGGTTGSIQESAFESAREGALVVRLLPARTDMRWWREYVMRGEIRLLRGRITFVGASAAAPFPSAIVIFRPPEFRLTMAALG
jgi:hypothetical protein